MPSRVRRRPAPPGDRRRPQRRRPVRVRGRGARPGAGRGVDRDAAPRSPPSCG